ncbi:hypothetical protein [Streptomyces sp. CB01881]|uniref:hypothetical protein n=1 Tax=Streptomyces sp. CB01881 TaxID=2078691 RepID=UPI000CDC6C7E|nr:hypothetical protein [Streptomyces sp. CB01881]AUY48572.1 hypothetical protein C2142_05960 [Streptomyces sp. CB01881]TYC77062.1 hypothetical protein EH183_05960 [Streptomyces sp. CB01881]
MTSPLRLTAAMSGAVALLASAALLPALAVLGELRPTWVALAAYTLLAAAVGRHSRPVAAPLIGLAAWLFHNGFVEHRHGALGWSGPAPEAGHLLLFTAAALLLSALAALPRRVRSAAPAGRDAWRPAA